MKYKLSNLVTIKYGKNQKKVLDEDGTVPIYGTGGLMGYANRPLYEKPSVLIGRKGTIEKVRFVDHPFWTVDTLFYTEINEDLVYPKYLYYAISQIDLKRYNEGTTIPSLRTETLNKLEFDIPGLEQQKQVLGVIEPIEEKIRLNEQINKNLYDQAVSIFEDCFPGINIGDHTVGEFITPKRGKGLISKDAVPGNVPVVAGGLEPATYHNVANTIAPVVTISASGANAGYVNLWQIPVWSSDSSFIDSTMTDYVFFWYVLLKRRQQEIFDAQTGSAQPHIYPQHISNLPLGDLDSTQIAAYSQKVKHLFELVGHNLEENKRLSSVRDTLLPKLMSGEIDVSNLGV